MKQSEQSRHCFEWPTLVSGTPYRHEPKTPQNNTKNKSGDYTFIFKTETTATIFEILAINITNYICLMGFFQFIFT